MIPPFIRSIKKNKAAFIFLILFAIWVITSFVSVRSTYTGSNDFDTFYAAGQAVIMNEEVYQEILDYSRQHEMKGPFLYPPFAAILFSLIAFFPKGVAAVLWNTINLGCFAGALGIHYRMLKETKHQGSLGSFIRARFWQFLVLASVLIVILLDNLSMAQVNVIVFFIVMLSIYLWLKGKELLAGIVLMGGIFIKVTPVLLVLFFILKRCWRLVVGMLIGVIIFMVIIPNLYLGYEKTLRYHQEWSHRMLNPIWTGFRVSMRDVFPGRLSTDAEKLIEEGEQQKSNLASLLVEKNQSLSAMLARYLLKDRNEYGIGKHWYAIYRVRRYTKLPVLFGGIPRKSLLVFLTIIQSIFLVGMCVVCRGPYRRNLSTNIHLELSLVFLTMTLIVPVMRSHQYIYWLYPLSVLFILAQKDVLGRQAKGISFWTAAACILYFLQGFPYGKAAGMGTFANLILWFLVMKLIISSRSQRRGAI